MGKFEKASIHSLCVSMADSFVDWCLRHYRHSDSNWDHKLTTTRIRNSGCAPFRQIQLETPFLFCLPFIKKMNKNNCLVLRCVSCCDVCSEPFYVNSCKSFSVSVTWHKNDAVKTVLMLARFIHNDAWHLLKDRK